MKFKRSIIQIWVLLYWILAFLYKITIIPILSIVINFLYILKILFTLQFVYIIKEIFRLRKIKTKSHLNLEYSKFQYSFKDFYNQTKKSSFKRLIFHAWPIYYCPFFIFISKHKKGTHRDAAKYAKKLYKYYLRNSKSEREKFSVKIQVYVSWMFPKCFYKVHYLTEVINRKNKVSEIYSNGLISFELKEVMAKRSLKDTRFFWMKNPFKIYY